MRNRILRGRLVLGSALTEGGWYGVDDRTVHWRPKDYRKLGSKVTLSATVYGVDLGNGMYGETDRTMTLAIGPAKIATIDDASKIRTVTIDGQVSRTIPASRGMVGSVSVDGDVLSLVARRGSTWRRRSTRSNR